MAKKKLTNLSDPVRQPLALQLIRAWMRQGDVPESLMARRLSIPWSSFCRWKEANAELWAGLAQDAKHNSDERVEASLYDQATGYTRTKEIKNSDGELVGLEEEYFKPNARAAMFVLINRRPEKWRALIEHENVNNHQPVSLEYHRGEAKVKVIEAESAIVSTDVDTVGNEPAENQS